MRVKGKADVDVEITTSELVVALKKEVYATLHLPAPIEGRVFVKGDRWAIQKTVHTSHSFTIEEDLGPALEDDVDVFTAFHTIDAALRD
tara:strand:- start:1575 stop:1841 length:267 start_codon:yes stop_codon:yes gene_type:complete